MSKLAKSVERLLSFLLVSLFACGWFMLNRPYYVFHYLMTSERELNIIEFLHDSLDHGEVRLNKTRPELLV